jgi:hypothetical protein
LCVNSLFSSSATRFHLNFQTRKINIRSHRDKENKRRWKTNFWQWQRGSGLGTLRDHVTFVTVKQKTGGWTEGQPHSISLHLKQLHYDETSGQLLGRQTAADGVQRIGNAQFSTCLINPLKTKPICFI